MDKNLREAVGKVVSARIKGTMGAPDPDEAFSGAETVRLEDAIGRAPLTKRELSQALAVLDEELAIARDFEGAV